MRTGFLYRLQSKNEKIRQIYIGSTWCFIISRDYHRNACNIPEHPEYNTRVHMFIREHGGWDKWDFVELYAFTCNGINERLTKEQSYRGNCMPSLNNRRDVIHAPHKEIKDQIEVEVFENVIKKRPYNKQIVKKTSKQYYIDNREKLLAKQNKKENCVCGSIISHGNISQHLKSHKHMHYCVKLQEKQIKII